MASPLVELRGVSRTYDFPVAHSVLRDVDLSISEGDRVSLVGPNGSGKTTLIRIILGVEPINGGTRQINDSIWPVAYVPQDHRNALFPWLRLRRNLRLASQVIDATSDVGGNGGRPLAAFQALTRRFHFSVDLDKYPYQLSGGEQQLFVLARALAVNPRFIVLDEPLAAVDFKRKRIIVDYLGEWLATTQATLVMATHDLEEALLLADRVCVLGCDGSGVRRTIPISIPWPRSTMQMDDVRISEYMRSLRGELA